MHLKNKLVLSFPAPLALPHVRRLDIAILTIIHLTILLSWISFLVNFPVIIGLAISLLLTCVLYIFGHASSKEATKFAFGRILLSFTASIAYSLCASYMVFTYGENFAPIQAWFLLPYVFAGLTAYDLYWISKGFSGAHFFKALKQFWQEKP